MRPNLTTETWEGSLLEWIELATADYFAPTVLLDYQRWIAEQVALAGNVVPFRLVSGLAPKGREFVRSDGTVLYGADNEPLAGLWKLVGERGGAPTESLRQLLAGRAIPGSWPPKEAPTRFTCRWGPAPRDLAERPEVQTLLLSFVADHVGGASHLESLVRAYGSPVALEPAWEARAADYRFAVAPKRRAAGRPTGGRGAVSGDLGVPQAGVARRCTSGHGVATGRHAPAHYSGPGQLR